MMGVKKEKWRRNKRVDIFTPPPDCIVGMKRTIDEEKRLVVHGFGAPK